MPKELRKLVFTVEEIKAAAYDYCLRNGVPIPHVPIDDVIIKDSDHSFLTLCFSSSDASDPKRIALGRDKAGAAVIKYCSSNKIPIPRSAQKVLKVDNGEVVMMISLNWKSAMPSE